MKQAIVLAIAAVIIAGPAGIAAAAECLSSTIAFSSTRDDPAVNPPLLATEIYLIDPDGTNARRLTDNNAADFMAKLSPDGKRIVFDSNRARVAGEPLNTSDLFLMKADRKDQSLMTRGSSATWSPDGKYIAFHRSASGLGLPINPDAGAATTDSDIFVLRLPDDDEPIEEPINVTNSDGKIDDDPDWSPDGTKIVFTRKPDTDLPTERPFYYPSQEIYVLNLETGLVEQLTHNDFEERGPAWSPDGTRLVFLCRIGPADAAGVPTFEICTMDADGTNLTGLTFNSVLEGTPTWSPDGQKIAFHRNVSGPQSSQLFVMNANGTDQTQLTFPPGINLLAAWGVVRDKCADDK